MDCWAIILVMSAAPNARLSELLAAPSPALSSEAAERVARDHFGVVGSATALDSERDQNFHIRTLHGPGYVLKIANPLESPEVTDFQTQALLHIAASDADLPVPRVCSTSDGATQTRIDIGSHQQSTVRLLTYLSGVPTSACNSTPRLRADLGACLARLGKALFDFSHPSANHPLLWNLSSAAGLIDLVEHIPSADHRSLVTRRIQHFERAVLPLLSALRWQVIYNDLNPGNVLLDPRDPERVTGIIDFGDMVYSPLVADVAVAAAYQLRHTPDPFDAAAQLACAYHRVVPLEQREIDLLFDLIATRLALAVIITAWRASLYPHNRRYILRNAGSHCDFLKRFEQMSGDDVRNRLRASCGCAGP